MKKTFLFAILLLVLAAFGFAQQAPGIPDKSLESFARIEILHEGRVKPLDSFARAKLLEWSARSSFKKESAVHFLARLFFDPDSTLTNELFRVNNPEVIYALGLSEAKSHRYSLDTLRPALQQLQNLARTSSDIEEKKRGPVDRESLRLFENVNSYLELLSAFRFAIPREDFAVNSAQLRKDLGLPLDRSSFSYIEIREVLPLIQKKLGRFSPDRGLENLSTDETALFAVSKSLMLYSEYYRPFVLPILPMTNGARLQWESPWKLLTSPSAKTEYQALGAQIAHLAALGTAWQAGDAKTFEDKSKIFGESATTQIRAGGLSPKPGLEIAYNRLDPFYLAKIFYAFALIGIFLSLVVAGKVLRPISLLLLILGLGLSLTGIGMRMILTGRPPITNLYETFLFVSTITVILGLLLEWFSRKGIGLVAASFAGLALLMVSGKFGDEGDTLRVLVAVLDSNFWLSTHVIAINLGYAGVVFSGVVGHVYLILALRKGTDPERLKEVFKLTYGVQAFGLLFSFTGTMLGGVWADQSWGRFWGWDPKENGALLIVLWGAILFHARFAGWIRDLGFAAGSVIGIMVVMMAWFGINLLGVGLHSYGFTEGLWAGLVSYLVAESLFVIFSLYFIYLRNHPRSKDKPT